MYGLYVYVRLYLQDATNAHQTAVTCMKGKKNQSNVQHRDKITIKLFNEPKLMGNKRFLMEISEIFRQLIAMSYAYVCQSDTVFSARCNIYTSRLCYDVSVRLSVRLSVCDGSALAHYS